MVSASPPHGPWFIEPYREAAALADAALAYVVLRHDRDTAPRFRLPRS